MTKYGRSVNRNRDKKRDMEMGNSTCLGCGEHLAYCGKPFSADLKCRSCGAINVYEDSQQPKSLRRIAASQ
jgi:hypothetical protein